MMNLFGAIATTCSGGPSNTIDIEPKHREVASRD